MILQQIELLMLYSYEILVGCYFLSQLDSQRGLALIGRLP